MCSQNASGPHRYSSGMDSYDRIELRAIRARTEQGWPSWFYKRITNDPRTGRPVARPGMILRSSRSADLALFASWILHTRMELASMGQPVLPPCFACGRATGSWCNVCKEPLCISCDREDGYSCPCQRSVSPNKMSGPLAEQHLAFFRARK